MQFYVYILYSEKLGRYYVGHTQNIDQRLEEHNSGQSKSTRNGNPWTLLYYLTTESRSEAVKFERKIKKRGAERFLTIDEAR